MFINTHVVNSEYINTVNNSILIKKITHEEDFILYKEVIKAYSAIPKGIIFEICKGLK